MTEKKFVDGMRAKAPHEKAPDFVKCGISIKVADFQKWLSERQTEWVNIQIKVGKSGNWYAEEDTWKPDASKQKHNEAKANGYAPEQKGEFVDDDIPF